MGSVLLVEDRSIPVDVSACGHHKLMSCKLLFCNVPCSLVVQEK